MPVDIKDYPPNSDKSKNETDYTKPTVRGKVSVRKTSEMSKRLRSGAKEIEDYTLKEVLLPGIKNAVWDIFTTALNILLYGESDTPNRTGNMRYGSSINYSRNYASTGNLRKLERANRPSNNAVKQVKSRPEEEIIFERKADADLVLDNLREAIQEFGTVSVQTLFDMCQQTAPWTANKYGWMDLEDAYVQRVRDGYILNLPRSLPLD